MNPGNLLDVGMFCEVVNSNLAVNGYKHGDEVYIAGSTMLPVSQDKPYLYKKHFIIGKVVDDHFDSGGGTIVSPSSLEPVSKIRQEYLTQVFKEDFGK